ncbi:MAG: ComF family protein [Bacteroidales bacterium]|nr:ComF family protein [Candidatus Sodaliphilus aphodohippi]
MAKISIKQIFRATADVLMPRTCSVCDGVLDGDERYLCRQCLATLPLTRLEKVEFNAMEQRFAGKVPIERATALFYYDRGNPYTHIIHDIKYRNMPRMGVWMGALAARNIAPTQFFDGIDFLIPVPLHRSKLIVRGYNQSMQIALGISQETGITAVDNVLIAPQPHSSQTRKGAEERSLNTSGIFKCTSRAASFAGKHVLIVDDVVTTGSTTLACAEALQHACPQIKISILSLAVTRLD